MMTVKIKKNMVLLIAVFFLCSTFLELGWSHAIGRTEYGEPLAVFEGDSGIKIISYCTQWSTLSKLESVHNELLKNRHGDEIEFLSAVYLYPDSPNGVASCYYPSYSSQDGRIVYHEDRYIELFNCKYYESIYDMARYLSHEYGHHFTFYYMTTQENMTSQQWVKSTYSDIRGLSDKPQITFQGDLSKPYVYEWDIAEILANDYVQLYGSSQARYQKDFLDVRERISEANTSPYYYDTNVFNVKPQDNLELELAGGDVPGLYDFFYELTSIKPIGDGQMFLVEKPQLTYIRSIYKDYNQYTFEWQTILDQQYDYTLLINEVDNWMTPTPIKTITGIEDSIAHYGSAINQEAGIAILENLEGDYEARVIMSDRHMVMHSSDTFYFRITDSDNRMTMYDDITFDYWVKDYIFELTKRGLVQGYPFGEFQPDRPITTAEYMTILVRANNKEVVSRNIGDDWFENQGYAEAANDLGGLEPYSLMEDWHQAITRGEMAEMIVILIDKPLERDKSIALVNELGIMEGYEDNTFRLRDIRRG